MDFNFETLCDYSTDTTLHSWSPFLRRISFFYGLGFVSACSPSFFFSIKVVFLYLLCMGLGGRKRSSFYYDLWNIKYLSKFKWDDLTEETGTHLKNLVLPYFCLQVTSLLLILNILHFAAYKHAIREQKLALEISAAKRERDFYLAKVDKSRALNSIEERLKKVIEEPYWLTSLHCLSMYLGVFGDPHICSNIDLIWKFNCG